MPLVSRDFEAEIITYTAARAADYGLAGIPVRTLRPGPRETRPAKWIRFELGSGVGRETRVTDQFTVIAEAYAGTQGDAVDLLNRFRALLLDAAGPTLFGAVDQAGPIRLPDPLIPEQVRYTARVAVRARATLTA